MGRGYRVAAILLGLMLAGAGLEAQPVPEEKPVVRAEENESASTQSDNNPTEQDDKAADALPDTEVAAGGPISADPEDNVAEEGEPYPGCEFSDVDECDLTAQQSMAKSTWWMNIAAWTGVILTLLGLAFIWRTLKANIAAAQSAKKSADTAERALSALERPHVFIEMVDPGIEVLSNGEYRFAARRFEAKLNNFGRSPALLIEMWEDFLSMPIDQKPDPIDPATIKNPTPYRGVTIGDGGHFEIKEKLGTRIGRLIGEPDAWHTKAIYYIGFARYGDILGNTYVTGFAAKFDPMVHAFIMCGDERYNYHRKEQADEQPSKPTCFQRLKAAWRGK